MSKVALGAYSSMLAVAFMEERAANDLLNSIAATLSTGSRGSVGQRGLLPRAWSLALLIASIGFGHGWSLCEAKTAPRLKITCNRTEARISQAWRAMSCVTELERKGML